MSAKSQDKIQIEVEVQKRGRKTAVVLWISTTRGARGKKKLLGEARTRDSETPAIHFKVTEGETIEELYQNFLRLLIHRGYKPLRGRGRDSLTGPWDEWESCDLGGVDDAEVDHVNENERRTAS